MPGKFYKKTIRDVPLQGKTVLVRVDYNVSLSDDGEISDDYRIVRSLPTLKFLINAGCRIVLCSHLGRPKGKVDQKYTLEPAAVRLGELLSREVAFLPVSTGDRVKVAVKQLGLGEILLLENLRFHPEEETNDMEFARDLATSTGAEYFVQDGFGVVHRAHASTDAITHFLPSVAGFLIEEEVSTINEIMKSPKTPLVAVIGGAKISDKIKIIERFASIADQIVIGGAMANTFLKYKGLPVGKSVYEEGQEQTLDSIYKLAAERHRDVDDFILLPTDVVVAKEISPTATTRNVMADQVEVDDYILDIGERASANMISRIGFARTVIWNGTLGYAEYDSFAKGSSALAMNLARMHDKIFSFVGGGDTADFVLKWKALHSEAEFGFISTGGGASLELMSGLKLPGVEALINA